MTNINGFYRKNNPSKPYFDVYFGKINIEPQTAFWFRYDISRGIQDNACNWAIFFKQNQVITGKDTFFINQLHPLDKTDKNITVFKTDENHYLSQNKTNGIAGSIKWDLSFIDSGLRHSFIPSWFKTFGISKTLYDSCFIDLKFSGIIKIADEIINIDNLPGMIGHIYGKNIGHSWAWVHCNHFENNEDVIFEILATRGNKNGKPTRTFTSVVLIIDGYIIDFSSTIIMMTAKSSFANGVFEFEVNSDIYCLKGKAVSPEKVALIEFIDTDNSKIYSYNSELSALEITFKNKKNGQTQNFKTSNTAAFEIVNRDKPIQNIDL